MRYFVILLILIAQFGHCQTHEIFNGKLLVLMHRADSLLITQNENSAALREDEFDQSGLILIDGKLNERIVEKKMWLSFRDRKKLLRIFTQRKKSGLGDRATCFEPHHTILIYYNSICYPVEICFRCIGIRQPDNIEFSLDNEFDKKNGICLRISFDEGISM
jgi:hypothetical protein